MVGRLHVLLAACIAVVLDEGHALCANATVGRHRGFTFNQEVPPRVIQDWDGEEVRLALEPMHCFFGAGAEAEVCVDGPNKVEAKFKGDFLNATETYNILTVHVDGKIPGQHIPLHVKGTRVCSPIA